MKLYPTLTNSRPDFKKFPEKLNDHLKNFGAPHLDSFNEMLTHGLENCAKHMIPVSFKTPAGEQIELRIESIQISRPQVPMAVIDVKNRLIYPTESRQLHTSYMGMCSARVAWSVSGLEKAPIDVDLGEVPIMLKSNACNLGALKPEKWLNMASMILNGADILL
ncbi:unnamed protein product [Ceratitis capitata]|uniref:DNA-directed RNA polymerase n=1 Tax=Ceratitis capitata TaxID=7213 RepID=A0A811UM47_CERCA|nr:unnamed protein product [Ceratitis capitata]